MAQAKHGDTVMVHYEGKLSDGTVFDASAGGDPLEFTIGEGQIIAGFEQAVLGMNVGESKTATIPADQAYGPRQSELVVNVERNQLPPDLQLEVGQQLQIQQAPGQFIPVVVTDVSNEKVTLDANHPLAGKDLVFDIQLMEIAA
ncbi:MAG: peptidylprolyl isomerase [Scytonema sp. PMC 1069.18]|nr:peptidylprolyl isomerase [Scytonema sp. PMC 1069.18]MEC4885673.1 peptidylprolyl isomerase [Scytonema sp. PMC 1070.18]